MIEIQQIVDKINTLPRLVKDDGCIHTLVGYCRGYPMVYVNSIQFKICRVLVAHKYKLDLNDNKWVARHTCRNGTGNKECINEEHLIFGSYSDNKNDYYDSGGTNWKARITHCLNGHDLADSYVYKRGDRITRKCKRCIKKRGSDRYYRLKESRKNAL